MNNTQTRDYTVAGEEAKKAIERGLVQAQWYQSPVSREKMKQLMKRKDGPAIRDTILWIALLVASGALVYWSWGSRWMIVTLLFYGNVYFVSAVSRWHECGHGTAFKTDWMNKAVYHLACFMILFQGLPMHWSHVRHHTDTIIVGRDPEIIAPRPPSWIHIIPIPLRFDDYYLKLKTLVRRSFGHLDKSERDYIDPSDFKKVVWEARIYLLLTLLIWGLSVLLWTLGYGIYSLLPAVLIGWPIIYGRLLDLLLGATQHLGLHEDVLDYRLNTRTFRTNFFLQFIYWNINYHLEHHMYPMVPYHALPKLHQEIKADCPAASPSFYAAVKETLGAMWKQCKDPTYTVHKPLPPNAQPYRM